MSEPLQERKKKTSQRRLWLADGSNGAERPRLECAPSVALCVSIAVAPTGAGQRSAFFR
jgi:hypothetical protein